MPENYRTGAKSILLILLIIFCLDIPALGAAEDGNDEDAETTISEIGDPDYYNIGEIVGGFDETTPIGIVDDI